MPVAQNVSSASAVARGLAVTLAETARFLFGPRQLARLTPGWAAGIRTDAFASNARPYRHASEDRACPAAICATSILIGLVERNAVSDQHDFAHFKPLLARDRDHPSVEPIDNENRRPRRTSRFAKHNAAGGAAALPVIQTPKRADRPQGQTMLSSCDDPEAKAEIRHALTIVSYVILYYDELISRDAETNATCPVLVGGRTRDSPAAPAHASTTARPHRSVAHGQVARRERR